MYQQPDYSTQPQPHAVTPSHVVTTHRQVDWRLAGAYIIAALAVGVACASLWLFHSYKVTVATQMTQLRHAVASAQTAQSKDANSISNLSDQISSASGELVLLAPYRMTCEQYLTGPNGGPTTFYLPCTDVKPASGS